MKPGDKVRLAEIPFGTTVDYGGFKGVVEAAKKGSVFVKGVRETGWWLPDSYELEQEALDRLLRPDSKEPDGLLAASNAARQSLEEQEVENLAGMGIYGDVQQAALFWYRKYDEEKKKHEASRQKLARANQKKMNAKQTARAWKATAKKLEGQLKERDYWRSKYDRLKKRIKDAVQDPTFWEEK